MLHYHKLGLLFKLHYFHLSYLYGFSRITCHSEMIKYTLILRAYLLIVANHFFTIRFLSSVANLLKQVMFLDSLSVDSDELWNQ